MAIALGENSSELKRIAKELQKNIYNMYFQTKSNKMLC